jgi:hypothetical protein
MGKFGKRGSPAIFFILFPFISTVINRILFRDNGVEN